MIPSEQRLRRLLPERERLAGRLADLDRRIDQAGADFSFERGYRVPLRRESLRRELDRMANR